MARTREESSSATRTMRRNTKTIVPTSLPGSRVLEEEGEAGATKQPAPVRWRNTGADSIASATSDVGGGAAAL